ncbi:MAG: hypothetical protein WCO36_08615 [Actinomycetes bacterium]
MKQNPESAPIGSNTNLSASKRRHSSRPSARASHAARITAWAVESTERAEEQTITEQTITTQTVTEQTATSSRTPLETLNLLLEAQHNHDLKRVGSTYESLRSIDTVHKGLILSCRLGDSLNEKANRLSQWVDAGVTHIVDCRIEDSDEEFVALHAPHITYIYAPTDDDGLEREPEWFDGALRDLGTALTDPDSVLLVHCAAGINRGPSLAFRLLLEAGWEPVAALNAIREARPVTRVIYAPDALLHFYGERIWSSDSDATEIVSPEIVS